MNLQEAREQIQEEILAKFDYLTQGELDALCQIIIENFAKIEI